VVGNIIPIYKNEGDSNDPKNFRPITLVSCSRQILSKAFSKYINAQYIFFFFLFKSSKNEYNVNKLSRQ
jgi:hypothetical protein